MTEKAYAYQFYNDLKDAGYFVYMHKTKIDKRWWIRIKIGIFNSSDAADRFGKGIKTELDLNLRSYDRRAYYQVLRNRPCRCCFGIPNAWTRNANSLDTSFPLFQHNFVLQKN